MLLRDCLWVLVCNRDLFSSSATICNPQMEGKELVDKLMDNSSSDKSRELFYKMIKGEEFDLAMMISTGGSDIL